MTSPIFKDGKLLLSGGKIATSAACCCNKCSGPCDEENPCPEGCYCNCGVCWPNEGCPCPPGCYCCTKIFADRQCEYACALVEGGCAGDTTFQRFGPYNSWIEAYEDTLFNTDNWCPQTIDRECCLPYDGQPGGTAYFVPGSVLQFLPSRFDHLALQSPGEWFFYEQSVCTNDAECCLGSCPTELWGEWGPGGKLDEFMYSPGCVSGCDCNDGSCENPLP